MHRPHPNVRLASFLRDVAVKLMIRPDRFGRYFATRDIAEYLLSSCKFIYGDFYKRKKVLLLGAQSFFNSSRHSKEKLPFPVVLYRFNER